MNITIIDGHPDPSPERLNHALADRYAQRAQDAGHDVRRIDIAKLDFAVIRDPHDYYDGTPPDDIVSAQQDIAWAEHLVFFFPLWMSDMPALLKAFFEQTFRPGFAVEAAGSRRRVIPRRLLKGRSARIVVTMGLSGLIYRSVFGAHMLKMLERLFMLVGIGPTETTILGNIEGGSECTQRKRFETIDRLVDRDVTRKPNPLAAAARGLAMFGAFAAVGYAGYTVTSWSRYGTAKPSKKPDTLLDEFMPNYEVALRHASLVNAPATVAFTALRISDLERSPMVRLLFGMREMLLRAKHDTDAPAELPFEKLTSLGWTMLAVDAGKEIVLGTLTTPWDRNARFRQVPAEQFASFSEPGYAKIALSIRTDEVSSEHCELRSETRVQTTDPISRARFRRYWAFLSPGMDIIRRVTMRQVRADAESIWAGSIRREVGVE